MIGQQIVSAYHFQTAMKRFPEYDLNELRLKTDPIADKMAAWILASPKANEHRSTIAAWKINGQTPPKQLPKKLQDYFEKTAQLPEWADSRKMRRAIRFFDRHAPQIMALLGSLALPYCYAAADGAQVLYLSERIRQDTPQRLAETALFVFEVMRKDAFTEEGSGLRDIQKVRLLHATIRQHIQKSDQWDDAWGAPINQEDMAGTNLAFSLIILRGLRKMGRSITAEDSEAYLHYWQVIGHLLGIEDALLVHSGKEASLLEQTIARRHFRASEAGQSLIKALLKHYRELPEVKNFPSGYITSYMRFLLGDKVADLLGIPGLDWTATFIQPLNYTTLFRQAMIGTLRRQETGLAEEAKERALSRVEVTNDFRLPSQLGF